MFSEPIQVITICVLVFTLLAIVVTCETLTRKAQLRHTAKHYTTQLNTLGARTLELLEAFNTVTAERDALRVERDELLAEQSVHIIRANSLRAQVKHTMKQRDSLRLAFNAKHLALEELLEEQNANAYD
jgi:uncharacterized coiled-coil DUF342 family protein